MKAETYAVRHRGRRRNPDTGRMEIGAVRLRPGRNVSGNCDLFAIILPEPFVCCVQIVIFALII